MAKILQLDEEKYDLWITYSWSNNNHGVCGHTFELIDYYLFLKNYFKVGALIAEDITPEIFFELVSEKYDLSTEELEDFKKDVVFCNRPSLVKGSNLLITDGGIRSLANVTLFFKNIFHFACGDFEIKDNKKDNVYILQDMRVYEDCYNGIDYVKKINFARYKKNRDGGANDILIYGTKNCRNIPSEMYDELLELYPERNFICLTSKENKPKLISPRMSYPEMPLKDLFSKFGTYIYTPVPRKFDCSPRFLAECKFYNKEVVFHRIDYWQEDKGLYWRNWDIENNFSSLFLNENDAIIEIIKEKCEL